MMRSLGVQMDENQNDMAESSGLVHPCIHDCIHPNQRKTTLYPQGVSWPAPCTAVLNTELENFSYLEPKTDDLKAIWRVPGKDWEYCMRREMQEIVPGLFLGPYAAAMKSKLNVLQSQGITHIVCIRQAVEAHFIRPNFPECFKYLVLDISDSPTENIIQHFRQCKVFLDESLAQGGKVLVHGNGGICRSAAIVTAYVMARYCVSSNEALDVVRNQRFCICINEGFMHQLMEFEHIYKAECLIQSEVYSTSSGSWKRKREGESPSRHMPELEPHPSIWP